MTSILFKLIPWGTLISLLFTWLAGKFGSGFMKWVLELVAENASKIDLGQMSKIGAEARNIELIQKATAPSWTTGVSNALLDHIVESPSWGTAPVEMSLRASAPPQPAGTITVPRGINTSEAKLINTIVYLKWLSDNKPAEFKKRMNRFLSGAGKLRSHSESDFMRFYTNPPDRG